MKIFKTLTFIFSLLSLSIYAREIIVAAGNNVFPYTLPDTDSGAEVEIIREIFKTQGINVKFKYLPLARVSTIADDPLSSKTIDGTARNMTPQHLDYFTNPYLQYENCLLIKNNMQKSNSIEEIFNSVKRIIAFQNAHKSFGKNFEELTKKYHDKYEEINDQKKQAVALAKKGDVAIIGDINIIRYILKNSPELNAFKNMKIECNIRLPNQKPYRAYFKDPSLRNAFNAGLKIIIANKTYSKILLKYELSDELPN